MKNKEKRLDYIGRQYHYEKKKALIISAVVTCLLTGCCMSHEWKEATCTEPKTCTKCDKTEGEALGHTWVEATCTLLDLEDFYPLLPHPIRHSTNGIRQNPLAFMRNPV